MPITVQYQAPAAVVGAAGMAQGQGDYQRWLREQQIKVALENAQNAIAARGQDIQRADTLTNAASQLSQQQLQAQSHLGGIQLQQQYGAQQSQYEAAQKAQQLAQQAGYAQEDDERTFAANSALEEQKAQRAINERDIAQQYQQQQAAKVAEIQARQKAFSDPFDVFDQQQKQAQTQGMTLSPDQQTQATAIKYQINKLKEAADAGDLTYQDAQKAFQPLHSKLNAIQPQTPVPDVARELNKKIVMDHPGLEGIPVTIDSKGDPQVIRGWRPPQQPKNDPLSQAKQAGLDAATDAKVAQMTQKKLEYINGRASDLHQEAMDRAAHGVLAKTMHPLEAATIRNTPVDFFRTIAGREWDATHAQHVQQAGGAPPAAPQAPVQPQPMAPAPAPAAPMPQAPAPQAPAPQLPIAAPQQQRTPQQIVPLPQFSKYLETEFEGSIPKEQHPLIHQLVAQDPEHAYEIPLAAGMIHHYGNDFSKWPFDALEAYMKFRAVAPGIRKLVAG